ncbi:MAG TPA: M1 family metallopeptidase [Bryobacteraceae bacterium]|nr:M1 family metallopeptidase [Bryobacteraceae bacterium]
MKISFAPVFLLIAWPIFAASSLEPPKLRLDGSAQPLHYAVDLTVIPDRDTFRGSVDISVNVRTPSTILWLNAVGLTVSDASFTPESGRVQAAMPVSGGDQFVGFSFERAISGKGSLHVVYTGKISRHSSAGIFEEKENRDWYVFSQFEPTDARRAFPCFDEPGFKVPWQMTLHVPKNDMALSNTPVQSESSEPAGMKVVRFKESRPLPSYLVALAVGPFDAVDAGHVGPTPVRVIVPRGKGAQAAYAAMAIPQLLQLLENYFGIPYPYEKLDSVVMPVSDFAMENAGMITYAESTLLANPASETIDHQRELAATCAHEMAHQWFGDFVTTAWWNDTWLNEAFATWMERKIAGEWRPEWHLDVSAVNARLGAMRQDELASARSIRQPIESNDDIANSFDDITYQKGAAVIEMFEHWISPEKFRSGVQLYLKQHAWGNATAGDFEAAISHVAGMDVAPVFNSFLDQPGVPEISAALKCGSKPVLELTQRRSAPIGSEARAQMWQIPVCVAYEADGKVHRECSVLKDSKDEMELTDANSCPRWILLNDGETGYYQAAYPGDLLKNLLADGARQLSVAERVGVLGDLDLLVSAGEAPAGRALALVPEFSKDPAPQVVETAADIASLLKTQSVPGDLREKGARFIRQEFGPQALALGWQAKPGDSDDTRLLRQKLVPFVASVGEQKELIEEAEKLAHGWSKDRQNISPDMIEPVLDVAAEFGDRDLFDLLRNAAVKERDHTVREELLGALGSFRDPKLAAASLDLLLSKDFDPRESFYPLLFGPLGYAETRDVPFEFVKQHLDALLKILPREVGEDYAASLPDVGRGFCAVKSRDEFDSFFADRVKDYTGGPRVLAQTIETIDLCIAARKTLAPQLSAFLKQY